MKYCLLFLCLTVIAPAVLHAQQLRLKKGMVITSSVTIAKDKYLLDADTSLTRPVITIRGKNITVNLNGAVLTSTANPQLPNLFYGLAIKIEKGSENITLVNANVHGYKVAILADSVTGLHIYNSDLSYNYRQHLHSNWQREDVSDWMSYHHNENGEWLRYGAGIYLNNCSGAVIKNNVITGGQCALMLNRCNGAEVFGNRFTFNSGLGIGMYRSSHNKVYGNNLDFNVRGYSDSIYYRGQDSGGILVFEQSSKNIFAFNSATHSGDGFFLWAGQHTMDTGEGGCNDNVLYSNNFSYAPTNGVELTFSRNHIEKNIINECDNAVWGGYSYNTDIFDNTINGNRTGVAIEHGQTNRVYFNRFANNTTAVKLWSRASQPADWGYAKNRDTRSRNYQVFSNAFSGDKLVYDIMGTDSLWLAGNHKSACLQVYKTGERLTRVDSTAENGFVDVKGDDTHDQTEKLVAGLDKQASNLQQYPEGRRQMRITEWGPHNLASPMLWLKKIDSAGIYHFEVLHPGGRWIAKALNGFVLAGGTGDEFTAKADTAVQQRFIELTYTGAAFTDGFGKFYKANTPYVFGYNEFDANANWQVTFYKWDSLHNPNKNFDAFAANLPAPLQTIYSHRIDYTWWRQPAANVPADSFATVAEADINLPESTFEISITAYDMVRVLVDGKTVIESLDASITALDENTNHTVYLPLKAGKHHFKIVQAANAGLAACMFYIKPIPQRGKGIGN